MAFLKGLLNLGSHRRYHRAITYYNGGRYQEAIEGFDGIIRDDKGRSSLYRELACFYKSQAYRRLGTMYMREGRYGDAIDDFKKALEIIPDSAILHDHLAECYQQIGDRQK